MYVPKLFLLLIILLLDKSDKTKSPLLDVSKTASTEPKPTPSRPSEPITHTAVRIPETPSVPPRVSPSRTGPTVHEIAPRLSRDPELHSILSLSTEPTIAEVQDIKSSEAPSHGSPSLTLSPISEVQTVEKPDTRLDGIVDRPGHSIPPPELPNIDQRVEPNLAPSEANSGGHILSADSLAS